ncbi:hypothetical protein J2Z69_002430 [Paenibacillus shirakamiensis]|uniref:DNA mimic protein DMP19 C-terminal domain-containing protein n=1 Tax=Paenibacillus shirakamiensis TaxID=1265935 RepID=A0ABS4JI40_9BACL|nr:DUF4375 domain-containing protein [Paenibacillus shirakamiensis]MBP2001387.1 hypothetical protein [Paenibacillus shirakamiensis]
MTDFVREPAWTILCEKLDTQGYSQLNEYERIWTNVEGLIGEVSGGSLISFFYNYGAEHYEDTLQDLHTLQAHKAISLVKKIGDLFPSGVPPKDIDERNEILESWDKEEIEELCEGLDDQFYELIDDLEQKLEPIMKKVSELQNVVLTEKFK